jgi:hypothetical protein
MTILFLHILVRKIVYNFFFLKNNLVYPISEKPTSIDSSRPFTSKVVLEKQSRREYKVNKEPIGMY